MGTVFPEMSRRLFLTGGLSLAVCGSATRAAFSASEEPKGTLTLFGPPTGSMVFADMAERDPFAGRGLRLAYKAWRSPDELRGGLVSGTIRFAGVPSYVGANLRARGLDVGLLGACEGLFLFLLSEDGELTTLNALAGKRVAVPFRGDMPDLLLRYCASRRGIDVDRDMQVTYGASLNEVAALLASGRADAAVLPEPFATAAIKRGRENGRTFLRLLDFISLWKEVTGEKGGVPSGGLLMDRSLFAGSPALFRDLLAEYAQTDERLVNDPDRVAELTRRHSWLDPDIAVAALPYMRSRVLPASADRAALEKFLSVLAEVKPGLIGGRLPDDGFYLL